MSADAATALLAEFLRATMMIAGPLLAVALVSGLVVGVIQTATQINESSVSFVVKTGAVIAVIIALGPKLAALAADYAHTSFEAVGQVVR